MKNGLSGAHDSSSFLAPRAAIASGRCQLRQDQQHGQLPSLPPLAPAEGRDNHAAVERPRLELPATHLMEAKRAATVVEVLP